MTDRNLCSGYPWEAPVREDGRVIQVPRDKRWARSQQGPPREKSLVECCKRYRLDIEDLAADTSNKRKILQTFYPSQFGDRGSTPLCGYSSAEIGRVFRRLVLEELSTAARK